MKKTTILILAALAVFPGCAQKKNRLTANTLVITMDPSTDQTVASGGTLRLTAICKSAKSDSVDISPVWTIDSGLGSLANASGKANTFTAGTTAGTGGIYATYGDVTSSVTVTVSVSGGGGGGGGGGTPLTGYIIYADAGASADIAAPGGFIFQYFDGGDGSPNAAPWLIDAAAGGAGCSVDPTDCTKVTYTGTLGGEWGGFYFALNAAKDFTAYSSLTFYVKGAVGGETYQISIKGGGNEHVVSNTSYAATTTSWQKITIPFTDFTHAAPVVNFASVQNCFIMSFVGNTPGVLYLDCIRYE